MELTCDKCKQKYYIPDYRLDDRRVYFYCEKCEHKIVIDPARDIWSPFRVLKSKTLSAVHILDGIFLSFNKKNFLLSYILLVCLILYIGINGLIVYYNLSFYLSHAVFSGIYLFANLLFLWFVFDFHLYLISKNILHRIRTGANLAFSSVQPEIFHDMKPIFILSGGLILFLVLLILPVNLFKKGYAVFYAGFFNPPLVLLLFIIFALAFFKSIAYSFVALRTRKTMFAFKSMIKFLAVENVNIPIYLFLISIVTAFISAILYYIALVAAFGVGFITALFSEGMPSTAGAASVLSPELFKNLSKTMADSDVRAGLVIYGAMFLLILLVLIAYLINLNQTLATVAVHIMESNPGNSIDKRGVLAFIIAVVLLPFMVFVLKFLF